MIKKLDVFCLQFEVLYMFWINGDPGTYVFLQTVTSQAHLKPTSHPSGRVRGGSLRTTILDA